MIHLDKLNNELELLDNNFYNLYFHIFHNDLVFLAFQHTMYLYKHKYKLYFVHQEEVV